MIKQMIISRMKRKEIDFAIDWAAKEGWNPGLHDAECFYLADPDGFFVGKVDNQIIAIGSAVAYDENFAFCGLYIVKEEYRGLNYGMDLTLARLKYLGSRMTGIDGVLNMVDKYSQIGYRTAYQNARYHLLKTTDYSINPKVVELNQLDSQMIADYDRQYFPAPRNNFLLAWISQSGAIALGFIENGKLLGYGVLRKCIEGAKIGPLFAENEKIAHYLLQALVTKSDVTNIYIDMPEPNSAIKQFITEYSLKQVFATARMYRNGKPELELDKIFGITTFELG